MGFVVGGRPPKAALLDLVKRWGSNITFQTHENGWITFRFPSADVRDRILSGGTYMVYGFHLVLQELPPCFRFREEDLNTLTLWVQIMASHPIVGTHMYLVGLRLRLVSQFIWIYLLKFARVLIELKADQPRIGELQVEFSPIDDVEVKFIYEQDINFCVMCNIMGHCFEMCQLDNREDEVDVDEKKK